MGGSRGVSRRTFIVGSAGLAGVTAASAIARAAGSGASGASVDTPAVRLAGPSPRRYRPETIGRSVEGRDLVLWVNAAPSPSATVLVVSTIHGNEYRTQPIGRALLDVPVPDHVTSMIMPTANPDGLAAETRRNANRVDLNRNFPFEWKSWTGGPKPFSEPEAQAIRDVVLDTSPTVLAFIHQPLEYVAPIGNTDLRYAAAWASGADSRVRTGVDQHGGAESWAGLVLGLDTLLVEARGSSGTGHVERQMAGFAALLDVL